MISGVTPQLGPRLKREPRVWLLVCEAMKIMLQAMVDYIDLAIDLWVIGPKHLEEILQKFAKK